MNNTYIKRGEIWIGDLGEPFESEQGDTRPMLILQNDIGNRYSETTVVAPITSSMKKSNLPVHVAISEKFLLKDSQVLLEQIRVISKSKLEYKLGKIDKDNQTLVDEALLVSIGLEKYLPNNAK
jgi:mRNA interferase MazF